ncbi:MAG: VOC family protein [Sphingobium sp.]
MTAPPPLRFYSIVLAVTDLPAMRAWYGRVLGFRERLSGGSDVAGTAFTIMEGAGTAVELVSRTGVPLIPETLSQPPAHLDGTGWKTLDLETDDLAGLDRHLRAEGVTILWSMRRLSPERAMTLVRDPEGNLIAFFGSPGDG